MATPGFPTPQQLYTQKVAAAMIVEDRARAGQSPYWCARDAWMCAALVTHDHALADYALERAADCALRAHREPGRATDHPA